MIIDKEARPELVCVVPLVYLPRGINQKYTYEIPAHLADRSISNKLVAIPFRKKKVLGIAVGNGLEDKRNIQNGKNKILSILSVLPYSALTPMQLTIANLLQEYYGASKTLAYKTVVPNLLIKKKLFQSHGDQKLHGLPLKKRIGPLNANTLHKLLRGNKKLTLSGALYDPRHSIFLNYISSQIREHGQVLCLLPELASVEFLLSYYRQYFGDEVIAWGGKESKGKLSKKWQAVSVAKAKIILAARGGIFLPFLSLAAIIVFDESDDGYKSWDQQPYYDSRTIVEYVSSKYNVPLIVSRVIEPVSAEFKGCRVVRQSQAQNKKAKPNVEIIDYQEQNAYKDKLLLSTKMLAAADRASGQNQYLIYYNRLDYAVLYCRDCGSYPTCRSCGIYLLSTKGQSPPNSIIKCCRCGASITLASECLKCGGVRLINIDFGIDKLYEEIIKLYPNKRIQKIISRGGSGNKDLDESLNLIRNGRVDITLASAVILPRLWSLPSFSAVSIIAPESMLFAPDWRAGERLLISLLQLYYRCEGLFLINTKITTHKIFRVIKSADFKPFIHDELALRRRFQYPPFTRLISLRSINTQSKLPPVITSNKAIDCSKASTTSGQRYLLKLPLDYQLNNLWSELGAEWKADVDTISYH